jgi:hypothetical protein
MITLDELRREKNSLYAELREVERRQEALRLLLAEIEGQLGSEDCDRLRLPTLQR